VAGNLAPFAHFRILLDFDERANLRFVADFASIQIDEHRELDVLPQLHVRRDAAILIHYDTGR
jgi:hypothetical protein